MADLITIEEAQRLVLERARRLTAERVPIERAYGRVLAEPAVATCDLPPFCSSAMDGFAVRSNDTAAAPVTLPVRERVAAGAPPPRALAPGEAIGIATGAVVPEGADAVVPLELVTETDAGIEIGAAVASGANVRPRAGDAAAGSVVLQAGATLGAAQVGALAAAGVSEVQCARRPRVGILVTGSELRPPGEPLGPGEIHESNGLMLAALLTSAGAVPAQLGTVADDLDEHRVAMERALLGFDMLVTSGGASVGPHDLVRSVQAALGVAEVFWGVAVKPGKPVAFGVRRDHLVFSLPGNPVSVLVGFELFVRPAINALLGAIEPLPAFAWGRLAEPATRNELRDEFLRARIERGATGVTLVRGGGQESHMIVAAGQADALVHVPRGAGELAAGSDARYLPLR
ncbi:MAG: molybdopterin molybdotransferase MoeA [Thermoleophilia bacterium]|nr:molybdopterin molybdotransferase MoeA [Thermoleophilia bacterium]